MNMQNKNRSVWHVSDVRSYTLFGDVTGLFDGWLMRFAGRNRKTKKQDTAFQLSILCNKWSRCTHVSIFDLVLSYWPYKSDEYLSVCMRFEPPRKLFLFFASYFFPLSFYLIFMGIIYSTISNCKKLR